VQGFYVLGVVFDKMLSKRDMVRVRDWLNGLKCRLQFDVINVFVAGSVYLSNLPFLFPAFL
jgi:hypothetical protein